MLCKELFKDNDEESEYYTIVCYNFATKTLKWYKRIPSSVQLPNGAFYAFIFRNETKNKLIQVADDKFVCVGAYDYYGFDQEGELAYDQLHYMLLYFDGTNANDNGMLNDGAFKTIISTDYTDWLQGIERLLSSAYLDGSDLFISGYDNWKPGDYKTSKHVGKIWKIPLSDITNTNGSFDFNQNIIYSCDNCLFFSIVGEKSDYIVCGEYNDKGNVLKGCYVTSKMIKDQPSCKPVLYTASDKQSCWFTQLCQYGSKIVLCGKAANSMDGKTAPLPFVVAYDSKGNKLWENLSFTDYTSALNIIPNTIGTYMLQLEGKNGIIHYVNADLLGNEKK